MKKLLLPVLVVIVMLASVSPAFAKGGKPPVNPGKGALKQAVTPAPKENGKPDKNVEKQTGKNKEPGAKNFVLFGTLDEVDLDTNTIKVTIDSGNSLAQGYLDEQVTIFVPDGAQVKYFDGEQADFGTLAELESATGETVRVHGWYVPLPEETTVPTEEVTQPTGEVSETVTTPWTARQVYLILDSVSDDSFSTVE